MEEHKDEFCEGIVGLIIKILDKNEESIEI